MKHTLLSILIVNLFLSTYSQYKMPIKNGYIVLNNRDTLIGQIKEYPLYKLSKEIFFKSNNAQEFCKYIPNEIKEFRINDIQFKSFTDTIISKKKKRKEIINDTIVFLRFLRKSVDGDILLYVLDETSQQYRFYYQNKNDVFKELKREITYDGSKKVTYDKYIIDLGILMSNHAEMSNQIRKTRYNEKDISKTIDKYNRLDGASSIYKYPHFKKVDFTLNFKLDNYRTPDNSLFNKSLQPESIWGYGIGFESHIYKPTKTLDFEMSTGVYYNKYSYEMESTKIKANYYSFPVYFSYNNKDKLFSFIAELGINNYISKQAEIRSRVNIETDWDYSFNLIANIGCVLNIAEQLSLKYIIRGAPLLQNSLYLSFRF